MREGVDTATRVLLSGAVAGGVNLLYYPATRQLCRCPVTTLDTAGTRPEDGFTGPLQGG